MIETTPGGLQIEELALDAGDPAAFGKDVLVHCKGLLPGSAAPGQADSEHDRQAHDDHNKS